MKKTFALFLAFALLFSLAACGNNGSAPESNSSETGQTPDASISGTSSEAPTEAPAEIPSEAAAPSEDAESAQADSGRSEILIAYFSWSGNTEQLANMIHEQTGGDIFEIERETPYSEDYDTVLDQAREEQSQNARPTLNGHIDNMEDYDIVFIGFPIWWYDMPMTIYSFLEEYDFAGKTVVPFCTHGGSGFSGSVETMTEKLSGSTVMEGFDIQGSGVSGSEDEVAEWLRGLGIIE